MSRLSSPALVSTIFLPPALSGVTLSRTFSWDTNPQGMAALIRSLCVAVVAAAAVEAAAVVVVAAAAAEAVVVAAVAGAR